MKTGAIVLCGGQSTRMGLDKASLPFGPEPMLTRVIRILKQVVQPVVVVAAPGQALPDLEDDVAVVRDRREGRGPLEGMAAGLSALQSHVDAAYVSGCDVPLLRPQFVARMFELLDGYDIAVPKGEKYHHPLAAVYRTAVLQRVQRLLDAGRMRPIFLFDEANTREVPVDELREVDPELTSLDNLNRPSDYLVALSKARFAASSEILSRLSVTPDSSSSTPSGRLDH